jgi:hypothetical protein
VPFQIEFIGAHQAPINADERRRDQFSDVVTGTLLGIA